MRTIGYIRVSTNEQAREGISLSAQRSKIEVYCRLNDLGPVEIIEDAGISAKNTNRPGLQRIVELIRKKQVETIVICKLDRLSRSVKDTITLIEMFEKNRVAFHAVVDRVDTTSATGKFFLHIMSALSEMERGLISERTSDCLQAKIKRGERVGQTPYGYDLNSDGVTLIENCKESEAIEYMERLRQKGYTYRKICAELEMKGYRAKKGEWHPQKIKNILAYQGRRAA